MPNKSKKDNISLIIQRNNIEKCCYVGDTNNDSISAKENNIPIVENKPLARMIYKEVELEKEIPHQMYQAVAEILVAIYRMKDKKKN